MTTSLGISATTTALRALLGAVSKRDKGLEGIAITTSPLDVARRGNNENQLNLFLYQTRISAAWTNTELPYRQRPGEVGLPPLGLELSYLLTPFSSSDTDSDTGSHRILGAAMSLLHDHPLLGRDEIRLALGGDLAAAELAEQIERIRIVPIRLSVDELSKLWTTFQTQFRLSVAYEVGVVLIESRRTVSAALPVLRRGEDDRGAQVLAGRSPVVEQVVVAGRRPAARLGEKVVLTGLGLRPGQDIRLALLGESPEDRLARTGLDAPLALAAVAGDSPNSIALELPPIAQDADAMRHFAPGYHTLVVVEPGSPPILSNLAMLALAPRIGVASAPAAGGALSVEVTCTPRMGPRQKAQLLVGSVTVDPRAIEQPNDVAKPTILRFLLEDIAAGTYTVRLRVDGVDSVPLSDPPDPTAGFDPGQQVTL
jgi:Pvc16 N-terminal domain